ncbi:DUF262 domain-containing protein [Acinetobacter guillouiae]|uniref:DUF262 domain-containing protein n=1 Tax=Acinetobacter guillouiae TaxID=106649 RepID=A0A8X8KFV6_ACIGI|nr:DUF262 domain-containing protein [Acinetobacter guillouiae]MCF0263427.1 DUF262 domain-containing protein [Acinetobacter guillouiae]
MLSIPNLIKVGVCTVEQLLSGHSLLTTESHKIEGILGIPEYQRPYVWGQKQIQRLIGDLREHHKNSIVQDSPYYLGSVILHSKDLHSQYIQLNIIDGQQRLTTLALIGYVTGKMCQLTLRYHSGLSIKQIKKNLAYLKKNKEQLKLEELDLSKIQMSFVITDSEDDAYKFFETQNTGGVRLSGVDIIKAHHLRALSKDNSKYQTYYAKKWEALGDLQNVVLSLLKGRYWNHLNLNKKDVPFYKESNKIRNEIVEEFSTRTSANPIDIAYSMTNVCYSAITRTAQQYLQNSYHLRQPLNAGINSISYLEYFQYLYLNYYQDLTVHYLEEYCQFLTWLKELKGCRFLEELYVIGLMLYICQFGEYKLEIFAKKFFRVAYSKRVSNEKAVRANSIPNFVLESKVLDQIATSFTAEQIFNYLDQFELKVDDTGLDKDSIKKEFIIKTIEHFHLQIDLEDPKKCAQEFLIAFNKSIMALGK